MTFSGRVSFFYSGKLESASSVMSSYRYFGAALMFSLERLTLGQRLQILGLGLTLAVVTLTMLERLYCRALAADAVNNNSNNNNNNKSWTEVNEVQTL